MKLIIDLPDNEVVDVGDLMYAVRHGIPLPKECRLIDANTLKFHEIDEIGGEYNPYLGCSKEQIDNALTIFEVREEEE